MRFLRDISWRVLPALLVLAVLVGCASLHETPADTLSGLVIPVCDRHDTWALQNDPEPLEPETLLALDASARVRVAVLQAEGGVVPNAAIRTDAAGVCDRHDKWLGADSRPSDLQRRAWLRSTALIRELVK